MAIFDVFVCIFGECENCPYSEEEKEDCSQKLLLDAEYVITSLECHIHHIDVLCNALEKRDIL